MMKSLPFSLASCYKLHSLNEPQTLAEELKVFDRLEMVSPSLVFEREKNILWESATFPHQRMYKTSCCLSSNFRHLAQQDHPPSFLRGLGIRQKPINNWNHSMLLPRNKYMVYLVSWWEKGKKGQQLLLPYYKITRKLPHRGSLWRRKGHIKAGSGLSAWRVGTPESPHRCYEGKRAIVCCKTRYIHPVSGKDSHGLLPVVQKDEVILKDEIGRGSFGTV